MWQGLGALKRRTVRIRSPVQESNCRFEPSPFLVDMICKYMNRKGLAAMLTSIQLAGATPEVNLRITTGEKVCKQGSPLVLKPRAISSYVQNRSISGPTRKDWYPPKMFKKIGTAESWLRKCLPVVKMIISNLLLLNCKIIFWAFPRCSVQESIYRIFCNLS